MVELEYTSDLRSEAERIERSTRSWSIWAYDGMEYVLVLGTSFCKFESYYAHYWDIAQTVEHSAYIRAVVGSIPTVPIIALSPSGKAPDFDSGK